MPGERRIAPAMKITDIKTFLMQAHGLGRDAYARLDKARPRARNWLFVKVYTDEGITGVGECSGWPRVIETALQDLRHVLIGQDPMDIERIQQRMLVSMNGHGMTGIVGSGAMTGIDMALWDIKGKALNTPVWNLLGGKMRDRIRIYAHANTVERALELKGRGITAIKLGGVTDAMKKVVSIREAVGGETDLMFDAHGCPWWTTADAISFGRAMEPYNLLFLEDPVAPDNIEALARVRDKVDIPLAAGERHAHIWGARQLIERELVDVLQPDTGRAGGITAMKKLAAMCEAHYITMAPHSGSLGPIAEFAALHVMAAIPNALMLERIEDDWPVRYQVTDPVPQVVDGHIAIPTGPGLGVDIIEDVVAGYPSIVNVPPPEESAASYEAGTAEENVYVQPRRGRHALLTWERST